MQGDELVLGPLSRQQESRLPRQNFPLNLPTNRRLCSTVGGRIVEGWAAHCCAVSAARSRAATMTNLARSSLALVLPALFGAAKSCALVNLCMICPRWSASGQPTTNQILLLITAISWHGKTIFRYRYSDLRRNQILACPAKKRLVAKYVLSCLHSARRRGGACETYCARAASGHAAAPPSSVMNSRLFTRSPRRRAEGTIPGP